MSRTFPTRWRPTPQQFTVLQELYRKGLTNPKANQIRQITAHLEVYGEIQGKNVFYWFQNHKARDRQKLRKKLAQQLHQQQLLQVCPNLNNYYHADFLDVFRFPLSMHLQPTSSYSPQNSHAQDTGVCKKASEQVMGNLPKDCLIRTYSHDCAMITHMGPNFPCYKNIDRPLETLELFPLKAQKKT